MIPERRAASFDTTRTTLLACNNSLYNCFDLRISDKYQYRPMEEYQPHVPEWWRKERQEQKRLETERAATESARKEQRKTKIISVFKTTCKALAGARSESR